MAEYDELQFLLEEKKRRVHVKDILVLVLRNIHWLILFALIGAVVGTYLVRKQEKIYSSNASIILKVNGANSSSDRDAALSGYSGTLGRLSAPSVRNEVLVLKSKTTLLEVVNRLKLNELYYSETSLVKRRKDLYKETPVEVVMLEGSASATYSMDLVPQPDSMVIVKIPGYKDMKVKYHNPFITPFGKFKVENTWFLTPSWEDKTIHYSKTSASAMADKYRYALTGNFDETTTSVVNLSLKDTSPQRAADIINMTIQVYNEDVVADRTKLIDYTTNYINERLNALSSDLGSSQSEIAAFKSSNSLLAVEDLGQQYLSISVQSNAEVEDLIKQRSMAEYLKDQLSKSGANSPIAASISIDDGAVSSVISQYNDLAFQHHHHRRHHYHHLHQRQ